MPGNITFSRSITVDGVLTNPTSIVLSDIDSTFGIKRLDTGAVVVAHNTAPTGHPETGIYQYVLESPVHDPVPGVTYRAVWKIVLLGTTYYPVSERVAGFVSSWLDYSKFLRRFGTRNVAIVSDKDNDDDPPVVNELTVQDAFAWAEAEINRHLKGGLYATPLDWTPNGNVVDPAVEEWGFVLAYAHLYYGRFEDVANEAAAMQANSTASRISKLLAQVYIDMAMVKTGLVRLPALTATDAEGANVSLNPVVVTPHEVYDAALEHVSEFRNHGHVVIG